MNAAYGGNSSDGGAVPSQPLALQHLGSIPPPGPLALTSATDAASRVCATCFAEKVILRIDAPSTPPTGFGTRYFCFKYMHTPASVSACDVAHNQDFYDNSSRTGPIPPSRSPVAKQSARKLPEKWFPGRIIRQQAFPWMRGVKLSPSAHARCTRHVEGTLLVS